MTWLLNLYPPSWRRRYGPEFRALIRRQPFSVGTTLDIIGGAIDAWVQPQAHLSRLTPHTEGDTTMLARALRLRCEGHGTPVTTTDGLKAAAVIIGGALQSLVLASWMKEHGFNPDYATAVMSNGWLIAFVVSMRYTTIKGWPALTQTVFMGTLIAVLVALAWLNVR